MGKITGERDEIARENSKIKKVTRKRKQKKLGNITNII